MKLFTVYCIKLHITTIIIKYELYKPFAISCIRYEQHMKLHEVHCDLFRLRNF
jgi:hypothetical protein